MLFYYIGYSSEEIDHLKRGNSFLIDFDQMAEEDSIFDFLVCRVLLDLELSKENILKKLGCFK